VISVRRLETAWWSRLQGSNGRGGKGRTKIPGVTKDRTVIGNEEISSTCSGTEAVLATPSNPYILHGLRSQSGPCS